MFAKHAILTSFSSTQLTSADFLVLLMVARYVLEIMLLVLSAWPTILITEQEDA